MIIFKKDDLPLPFLPIIPIRSPRLKLYSNPSKITRSSKDLYILCSSRIFVEKSIYEATKVELLAAITTSTINSTLVTFNSAFTAYNNAIIAANAAEVVPVM